VPDVVAVTGRVLVTRWVDGTPLSRVIAAGTDDERHRAGLMLIRLFASAPVRAHLLHGDPHPGNFRLLPDGRLAVLDFGATEAMPRGWPARLGPLLEAGRHGDATRLHHIALRAPRTGSAGPGCGSRPCVCPTLEAPPRARSAGCRCRPGT
jgi:predicted unusual protein kinase regulating ubiquinone biosynthesis (AarF/ABC1/UbiB family)